MTTILFRAVFAMLAIAVSILVADSLMECKTIGQIVALMVTQTTIGFATAVIFGLLARSQ